MSKRRGVPLDEKRARMLQIFHEKRQFFTLKEIENIAPKEKGIVVQSVKDILQALVDDDSVHAAKIATSTYYWMFPGENITPLERVIADKTKKLIEAEFRHQKLKEGIVKEKVIRKEILEIELKSDTEESTMLLQEVEALREKEQQVKQQVARFNVDPEVVAEMQGKAEKKKNATNAWTDNIFAIQSWCKNKFGISQKEFNKQFDIPEDFDYKE